MIVIHTFSTFMLLSLVLPHAATWDDDDDDDRKHFPDNEFVKVVRDIWNKLGMKQFIASLKSWLQAAVRTGQDYSFDEFDRDISNSIERSNAVKFLRTVFKGIWSSIVQGFVYVFQFGSSFQQFILAFLRRKCDETLGEHSSYHPWSVLSTANDTHLSFYAFIVALLLILVLGRFLTWLQYATVIASTFLLQTLAGPRALFYAVLGVAGIVWFVIDLIIGYPLEVACLVLVVFVSNVIRARFVSAATVKPPPQPQHVRHIAPRNVNPPSNTADIVQMDARLDSMEMKTSQLNDRLERLCAVMERFAVDDDEN